MANQDLLVGSIVKLSPKHLWARVDSNPLDTIGEVTLNEEREGVLIVHWTNGRSNSYKKKDSDLILIESP